MKSRGWTTFCLVVFLLSGCAGSAGNGRSSSQFSSQTEFTSGSGAPETSPTDVGRDTIPSGIPEPPFKYPIAIDVPPDDNSEPRPLKYPIAIDVPPDDNSEPRPLKYPIAIDIQPEPEVRIDICRTLITDIDSGRATSFDPCNRATIPGLIPLYDMVSADVSAKIGMGETPKKVGVIFDRRGHGQIVMQTATITTRQELFNYIDLGNLCCVSDLRRKLQSLDKNQYLSNSPIVNFSLVPIFSTLSSNHRITFEDIQKVGALVVAASGNDGSEQPKHNRNALKEIHEKTGSLLIVTGLNTDFHQLGLPLIDKNGFHKGYTLDDSGNPLAPEIHGHANRCGNAMNFCVAAPYSILIDTRHNRRPRPDPRLSGTSISTPLVFGTLVNLRYVWPHLTNQQLVRLACVIDPVYGCGQFSVSDIWQPTGQLVEDPIAEFSLDIAEGAMQLSGASFGETVTVTGYENNEFARDYQIAVPASSSPTSLSIEPTISWDSLNTMLEFRNDGSLSLPVANGRGSAAHLFKDTFLFFKEANRGSAIGLSHASGLSIAFERETDSFFGSIGSGSYEFGDTNKFVASFDRQFNLNETYGVGVKLAAAYGEMEPDISLIKSAKGTAQTAQVAFVRKRNNFESRLEMNYNTGLKGTVSIQNTDYRLKPRSETAVMLKMRFAM